MMLKRRGRVWTRPFCIINGPDILQNQYYQPAGITTLNYAPSPFEKAKNKKTKIRGTNYHPFASTSSSLPAPTSFFPSPIVRAHHFRNPAHHVRNSLRQQKAPQRSSTKPVSGNVRAAQNHQSPETWTWRCCAKALKRPAPRMV